MILVLDNYDSFTWNLVQYLQELGADVEVVRNDQITVAAVADRQPAGILVSPGPCDPSRAGISLALIRALGPVVPLLGVCLGHQAIGEAVGGRIVRAPAVRHGKTSPVDHDGRGVFEGLPNPLTVTRYHSLVIDPDSLPAELVVTSRSLDDGQIMGVRHRHYPIEGVQFHPESILSEAGHALLANFLRQCGSVR